MTFRHNWQVVIGSMAVLALGVPVARAQGMMPAGTGDLDIRESAIWTGIGTWRRSLEAQPGQRAEAGDSRRRAGQAAAVSGDARALLGEVRRQVDAWRETAATIGQWENEQASLLARDSELLGRAQACAVERHNRRTMLAGLAQLDQTLARWPATWRQLQADKARRLDRVAQLLGAPATYGGGLAELKSWLEEFRHDAAPAAVAADSPAAAELFTALTRRLADIRAAAETSVPAEEAGTKSGQAAFLVQSATAYPREQRARRQLQADLEELAALAEQWADAEWRELAADARQLGRLVDLVPVQPRRQTGNRQDQALTEFKSNLENFEYFELPKAMTLRQASAEPLVYGDPEEWSQLAKANPEVAASPDAELAAGTLLIVPRKTIGQP
ncbi:MAG: hypothetical protein RBU25_15460 [Lentisphaeria bacterium]|nr:hypothetical protein [Lentisphaeria bacterium]